MASKKGNANQAITRTKEAELKRQNKNAFLQWALIVVVITFGVVAVLALGIGGSDAPLHPG